MERPHKHHIILAIISLTLAILVLLLAYCWLRRRRRPSSTDHNVHVAKDPQPDDAEGLMCFPGGEDLTVQDILEAPGEVVGKSSYGTLYHASLQRSGAAAVLRFVRPTCAGKAGDVLTAVTTLGLARHPNLVPLFALYVGPNGENLLVHPFYAAGNLSSFLQCGSAESNKWEVIHQLSLGIARGLHFLHCGLQKLIIHGNLKTKNVLLDSNCRPRVSDFGLHLLLNPTSGQEMLESSAVDGYKAPELIKMKEASRETDIYSLGIVMLEMVTRRQPGLAEKPQTVTLETLLLENKLSDSVSRGNEGFTKKGLMMYFQLAMACCSPSPALRPDVKQVVRKLEEMGGERRCN